jgi:serine/threonine protein kinase/Tfp pilus assembly protein PilF
VGTNDSPNNPRASSSADSSDRTLSTGGPGGPAAGQIGPYRLLQMLGEGGMGEVWLAEQKTPIHRTVALKLIKAGMDTKAVVARFESERQALALMDHTNIARVFDAGSTPEGRPYFVMEYVPGLPITEYCDKHKLTVKERLELFMQVCDGVQHAHQKAIIHRDLKPSNVLVVEQDGKAAPKIIDFGLAKAMAQRLTDKTMFTEIGVMMGTPEYMSPEQADQSELNIDTRTDVYSLGVILYQLLVGVLPLEAKALRAAGMEAILRAIREQEPPTPSNRIRSMGPASSITAANRKEAPQSFARHLQGELDWITMKALEKDRNRRYSSPSDLSADIQRHLGNEPVTAHPPSAGYRAAKYFRRHRVAVSTAAAGVVLLAGFVINQAIQLRRITRERDRADRNMFKVSRPSEARGNAVTAREILDKASKDIDSGLSGDPELQARLMAVMGSTYLKLGLFSEAQSLYERAIEIQRRVLGPRNPQTLDSMFSLGAVLTNEGRFADAEKIERETLEIRQQVLGPENADTLFSMSNLANTLSREGHRTEAEKLEREALEGRRRTLGSEDRGTLRSMMDLGSVLTDEGKYQEAETLDRETVEMARRVFGPEHPETLQAMNNLSNALSGEGRYAEAEKIERETLEIQRRILGPAHAETLNSMNSLATTLEEEKQYAEAEKLERETLEIQRRVLGPEHPDTLISMNNLATVLMAESHWADAEKLIRETHDISSRVLGPEHPNTLILLENEALCISHEGRYDDAAKLFREAIQAASKTNQPGVIDNAWYYFGTMAASVGRRDQALEYLGNAIDHGFRNADQMQSDDDLKSLKGDPRFEALVAKARQPAAAKANN